MRRPPNSKLLIAKLRKMPDLMERILKDNGLAADVQISDINMLCWATVQIAMNITTAIEQELSDLEGEIE